MKQLLLLITTIIIFILFSKYNRDNYIKPELDNEINPENKMNETFIIKNNLITMTDDDFITPLNMNNIKLNIKKYNEINQNNSDYNNYKINTIHNTNTNSNKNRIFRFL
jgi:hypothetical protein